MVGDRVARHVGRGLVRTEVGRLLAQARDPVGQAAVQDIDARQVVALFGPLHACDEIGGTPGICIPTEFPTESTCDDGVDNDCDQLVDCDDPACDDDAACMVCVPTEANETVCDDGIDSDCDGDADCADADCTGDAACQCGRWLL